MTGELSLDFTSDNSSGAHPAILEAIVAANSGPAAAYGADDWTKRAERALAEVFEREVAVFLVATGTAANALALSAVADPWGAILCHEFAHIAADECGAPEFFSAGAKLVGLPGAAGKVTPAALSDALALMPRGIVKQVQPQALSLSQATECGALYTAAEIAALAGLAHESGMAVHMDGARFANALVALSLTPAEMSWKAGVDVLSFGATKNGALACEAVIFFDADRARNFAYRRKRGGHTLSKGRLLGAQMEAYLKDGLWLALAREANARAAELEVGLAAVPGVRLPWKREINEVFAVAPASTHERMAAAGARYHPWTPRALEPSRRPGAGEIFVRLIPSFATSPAAVARLIAAARG
ncbi:MAG TPA: beta-eliminating lyase-related protein [Rhodoblastus sp.]|nr:beta-eliminating lyase-related protein [Rhodoblastus sp.]